MKSLSSDQSFQFAFWAVCLFFAALTFSSALMEISFFAALVFWTYGKTKSRNILSPKFPKFVICPILIYTAIACLSFFWSENQAASFRGIFKVLQQVFLFWMTADLLVRADRLRKFEILFIIVMAFTIANALAQFFLGNDLIRGFAGEDSFSGVRLTGSFKSYGLLAAFLLLTIPLLGAIGLKKGRVNWKCALVIVSILAGGITVLYMTRSRGAFVAFAIAVFVLILWLRRFRLILFFLVGLMLVFFMMPREMIFHLDYTYKEQSLVERYYLWDRAWHVIKAKPLTGTGINTYAVAHQKYDETQNWRVRDYYAHNGYLQMAAEIGLPGLFAFLAFLYFYVFHSLYVVRRSKDFVYEQLGLLTGIAGFLVMAFVDTILHNSASVLAFWFILGVQAAYWLNLKQQK